MLFWLSLCVVTLVCIGGVAGWVAGGWVVCGPDTTGAATVQPTTKGIITNIPNAIAMARRIHFDFMRKLKPLGRKSIIVCNDTFCRSCAKTIFDDSPYDKRATTPTILAYLS